MATTKIVGAVRATVERAAKSNRSQADIAVMVLRDHGVSVSQRAIGKHLAKARKAPKGTSRTVRRDWPKGLAATDTIDELARLEAAVRRLETRLADPEIQDQHQAQLNAQLLATFRQIRDVKTAAFAVDESAANRVRSLRAKWGIEAPSSPPTHAENAARPSPPADAGSPVADEPDAADALHSAVG